MSILVAELCELLVRPGTALRLPVVRQLLSQSFPPLFKPHPNINPASGRVLSRPLGGDRGMSDWYEEDGDRVGWRSQPGLAGVVALVVRNVRVSANRGSRHARECMD